MVGLAAAGCTGAVCAFAANDASMIEAISNDLMMLLLMLKVAKLGICGESDQ